MASWFERIQKTKRPDALIEKMVERAEEIYPKLEELKKLQAEIADIKQALEYYANEEYVETSEVGFIGETVQFEFSARSLIRKIKSVKDLIRAVGKEVFEAHATFPLEKLDELVSKEDQKKFVISRRIGTRVCRIKFTPKEKK